MCAVKLKKKIYSRKVEEREGATLPETLVLIRGLEKVHGKSHPQQLKDARFSLLQEN